MLEKLYIIRGNNYLDTPCIAKISYGKKYVIAKCKSLPATLKNIEDSLNTYLRGGKINPNGLYYFLNLYVEKHPDEEFKVEILEASDSPYKMLIREHLELEAGKTALLNNQKEVYIPGMHDNGMYAGWIRPIDVTNFKAWLLKHKKERANEKRRKTARKKRRSRQTILDRKKPKP
jgi:hypothetical protein